MDNKKEDMDKLIEKLKETNSMSNLMKFTDIINDLMIMQGDKSAIILKSQRNISLTLNKIVEDYILPHQIDDNKLQNILNFFKNTEKMCNDFKEFLGKGD